MTDKELIQALRDEDITDVRDMMDCMEAAADRLEFLLRECAELKLQIQKEITNPVGTPWNGGGRIWSITILST